MERCSEWVQQQLERHLNFDFVPPEDATIDYNNSADFCQLEVERNRLSDAAASLSDQNKSRRQSEEEITNDPEEPNSAVKENVEKQRQRVDIRILVLDLRCGWAQCSFRSQDVKEFINHVSFHVRDLKVELDEDGDGVYACLWEDCDFDTPDGNEATRHVNYHSLHTKSKAIGDHVSKALNLPPCQYDSRGHNYVPDQPEVITCHWVSCTHTSNNINMFIEHVNTHALEAEPKEGKLCKCSWRGCTNKFFGRSRIIEHLRTHTQEKPVACSVCGSLFASRTKLVDHLKAQTPLEKRKFQCSNCSRYYPSERLLRDHMRQHVNHYKCRFCDMTCPTTRALSLHIRYRHLDDKPFCCRYCTHKAKTHQDLTSHFLSHIEGKSYQCISEGCNYSCRALTSLRWHFRKEHNRKESHSCHMCDKKFFRGSALTKHLIENHDFHWPAGHSRFRYKEEDDGYCRLQTVRYESLEVTQQIMSSNNDTTASISGRRFVVEKSKVPEGSSAVANFIIREGENTDECVDDPGNLEVRGNGASMPDLTDSHEIVCNPKAVLISIEEVDSLGNIINTKTLEAEPFDSEEPPESARPIEDGITFMD